MQPFTLKLGRFRCDVLSDGTWWFDGGCIFGIVPRSIWEKLSPPDSRNRIKMGLNSLLLRDGRQTILIETGVGSKITPKRRSWHDFGPSSLLHQLAAVGCPPDAVDLVILTHLHFDHTGGSTSFDRRSTVIPTFPRARYVVQSTEWDDAVNPSDQTRAGYLPEDFLPFAESGQLQLTHDDEELVPGVKLWRTGGHTRGHQVVVIEDGGRKLCYAGDLIPLAAHVRPIYMTAFDLYPIDTFAMKTRLLEQAAREDWRLLLGHDDDYPLIRVVQADNGFAFEVPTVT